MLPSIVASVGALVPLWGPDQSPAHPGYVSESVEVAIEVGTTRFEARNVSNHAQLLIFGNASGGPRVWRTLEPGQVLGETFPRSALDGVLLEVVALRHGGDWTNSGALSLGAAQGSDAIWIQSGDAHSHAWMELGGELQLMEPDGNLVPPLALGAGSGGLSGLYHFNANSTSGGTTHVPVITPREEELGDSPPVLEEKPLPPI